MTWSASASTEAKVSKARAGDSARGARPARRHRPRRPYAKRVEASGEKAFVEAITLRKEDVSRLVAENYFRIKGAVGIPGQLPFAPTVA